MESSANSNNTEDEKPFLSFFAIIAVVIGAFFILKKYIGSIPAVIVAYLIYVYRNEIKDTAAGVLHERH